MSAEGGGSTKFSDNDYLEKHQVHEMFAQLLSRLAVVQPENPIGFLVSELQAPAPALVCVFGPPGAGKSRLCASLAQQLGVPYVSTSKLLQSVRTG